MKVVKQLIFTLAFLLSAMGAHAGPVNINTADAEALAANLSGVGPKIAQRIIDYRTNHGPFKAVDALQEVKGIGTKILERNRANILLSPPAQGQQ